MFKYKIQKDFFEHCIESTIRIIEACNDFYKDNKINKIIIINIINNKFNIYISEKNRYECFRNERLLYSTKNPSKLLKYAVDLEDILNLIV